MKLYLMHFAYEQNTNNNTSSRLHRESMQKSERGLSLKQNLVKVVNHLTRY